jgi:hypothetical protein
MAMKWYAVNGVNFYEVFGAGVSFARAHRNDNWSEEEYYAALEAALPEKILAQINDEHNARTTDKQTADYLATCSGPKDFQERRLPKRKNAKAAGGKVMKRNQHVIVKSGEYKGRTGTVDADSIDGVVQISFDDEAISHEFMVDELRLID